MFEALSLTGWGFSFIFFFFEMTKEEILKALDDEIKIIEGVRQRLHDLKIRTMDDDNKVIRRVIDNGWHDVKKTHILLNYASLTIEGQQ